MIKEKSRPLIYSLEVYKLQNGMKLEKFTTESGIKFIDDALGFNYLLFFRDCLRRQCTNSKIKVFANIGYDISFKSITLQSQQCLNIFSLTNPEVANSHVYRGQKVHINEKGWLWGL